MISVGHKHIIWLVAGGAHNTNNFSRGSCQVISTHRGNIFHISNCLKMEVKLFAFFSNGKTDSRRNKCHLLSQKTLFLLSFNLNFLSWPDPFEESFQVRNTKFLRVARPSVTLKGVFCVKFKTESEQMIRMISLRFWL